METKKLQCQCWKIIAAFGTKCLKMRHGKNWSYENPRGRH